MHMFPVVCQVQTNRSENGVDCGGYASFMTEQAASNVTTVIATRDRWTDLQRSLDKHSGPVILVDNGSADGTPDLVEEHFPHVRVVRLPVNRGAVARNVGVRLAHTPYVAFADDDSWWDSEALPRAAELFRRSPRLGLVAARVRVGEHGATDPVSAHMAEAPLGHDADLPGPNVLGFLACASVVRRSAFLAVGGFDDVVFFAGEEERVAIDLRSRGWGLAYVESVVAHHHPSLQRSTTRRDVLDVRNRVLTAVMRRPWPVVRRTARSAAASGPAGRTGVAHAAARSHRALARRHVVPPDVEAALRRAQHASG
jgi:GT2 family glycosyltransferase